MLRKLIITTIVASFLSMLGGVISSIDGILPGLSAANTTISGFVSATVPDILELGGYITQIDGNVTNPDVWAGGPTTDLDFGTLVHEPEFGALRGENYFVALMFPVSSGRKFQIAQTGSSLGEIPDNRYVVTPDYSGQDKWAIDDLEGQGTMPIGASLGYPASAAGTNTPVYTSDTEGKGVIVRGFLSIPLRPSLERPFPYNYSQGTDGSGTPVGSIQEYTGWHQLDVGDATPGEYSGGTVTFTLSLIS